MRRPFLPKYLTSSSVNVAIVVVFSSSWRADFLSCSRIWRIYGWDFTSRPGFKQGLT